MLTDEERMGLTIWGDAISAQVRHYADTEGMHLALHIRDHAPRSQEEEQPVILGPKDVALLRALLDEAERRENQE